MRTYQCLVGRSKCITSQIELSGHCTYCTSYPEIRSFWASCQNIGNVLGAGGQPTILSLFLLRRFFFSFGFLRRSLAAAVDRIIRWYTSVTLLLRCTLYSFSSLLHVYRVSLYYRQMQVLNSFLLSFSELSEPFLLWSALHKSEHLFQFTSEHLTIRTGSTMNHHLVLDCNTRIQNIALHRYDVDTCWNSYGRVRGKSSWP